MKDSSYSTAIACIAGIVGSVLCFILHVCMAGHMHHPPYALWHYILDVLWPAALIVAAIRSQDSKIRRKKVFLYLAVAMIPSRLLWDSLGGTAVLWEFPIAVYLAIVSLRSAWLARRAPVNSVAARKEPIQASETTRGK